MTSATLKDDASIIARIVSIPRAAEILHECKDRMVGACLAAVEASGLPLDDFFGKISNRTHEDIMPMLEAYMRLDEDLLSRLPEQHAAEIARIAAEARETLAPLLDEEASRLLETKGITLLLAASSYPIFAEFLHRLNDLPVPGRNLGDYRGLFCPKPFQYAEIGEGGRTFLCCPLQVPTIVGDARDGTFLEVWNSEKAQAIRRSILDGSFSHCVEKTCGALQNRMLPKREDIADPFLRDVIDNNRTKLDRGPAILLMNYDSSCNLACPTCRTHLIVIKGKDEKEEVLNIQDWATAGHLRDAQYVHITGSGDAFASAIFREFLRKFDPQALPGVRLGVGTNGLMFTEQAWGTICKEAIDCAVVSVDAASRETYRLNRGGDFDLLLNNLAFIGGLRTSGQLKHYSLNFVVQDNNYLEMPAFVALAESVHADSVCFQKLMNWGTFTDAEFRRRAVHLPRHPRHDDFLRLLSDPVFGRPIVDLHSLSALRSPA